MAPGGVEGVTQVFLKRARLALPECALCSLFMLRQPRRLHPEEGGRGRRQVLGTLSLRCPGEFSLQPCNGSLRVSIVKTSDERFGKESYLFKVRELIQGQVGIQGLLFLIKVHFNPSHKTLFLAASKAPALVHSCRTETSKAPSSISSVRDSFS